MGIELNQFKSSLRITATFLGILWIIHILQAVTGLSFARFGVIPKSIGGFKGVFTAPLIHGDWNHLIGNSVPLFILMTMIFSFYRRIALVTFLAIYLGAGVVVWLIARPGSAHIGASGLVYGLASFVFWMGIFSRNVKSIALCLVVVFLYSGLVAGLLPNQQGVSWETHLFGALIGMGMAFMYKKYSNDDPNDRGGDDEDLPPRKFLDPNTFEDKKNESWTTNGGGWKSSW